MSIGISTSSGDNTGINTDNPQANAQPSSLQTGSSTLQTPVNPQSVYNSSAVIPLSGVQSTTRSEPLKITPKTTNHVSSTAFIPIVALVLIALISCGYIYMMSKKPNKFA